MKSEETKVNLNIIKYINRKYSELSKGEKLKHERAFKLAQKGFLTPTEEIEFSELCAKLFCSKEPGLQGSEKPEPEILEYLIGFNNTDETTNILEHFNDLRFREEPQSSVRLEGILSKHATEVKYPFYNSLETILLNRIFRASLITMPK
jgi:hypothetical protein